MTTADGRAANRRVEVLIDNTEGIKTAISSGARHVVEADIQRYTVTFGMGDDKVTVQTGVDD